jgi:hypothetical protein
MRLLMLAAVLGALGCGRSDDTLIPSDVATPELDGRYTLDDSASFEGFRKRVVAEQDPKRRDALEKILAFLKSAYSDFRISHGVIRSGSGLVQEFSLKNARREGNRLRGTATHHEDVHDPGDMQDFELMIQTDGNRLLFVVLADSAHNDTLYFTRK